MKRPLVGLTLAYATGVGLASLLPISLLSLVGIGVVALLFFFLVRHKPLSVTFLIAAVAATGAIHYSLSADPPALDDLSNLLSVREQNLSVRGFILSDPGYRPGASPTDRHSFILQLHAINRDGQWEPTEGRVWIFVSANRQQSPLRYGDEIECSILLRVPPPPTNPGQFDWRQWLATQQIKFIASLRKTDDCTILAHDRGNPVQALSFRLREHFENALRLGLEKEPTVAGVVAGMVIGERSQIPEETYEEFQQTGVFHVFATAGLHVGVVTVLIVMILRFLSIPRRWCALIALPLLLLYVLATGARPCAVRALIMASVWLIGWLLVRPTDPLSILSAAALTVLLWNPLLLFDSGFLLSFCVVLSLILLTPRLEACLQRLAAPDPFLPEMFVPSWRKTSFWPWRKIITLLCGTLAAWIGLLPLMALDFQLFSPISILANLLVIPLVSVIIPIGMLSALAYSVWPSISLVLNNANFFWLSMMLKLVHGLHHFPLGHWFVQSPPLRLVIFYYLLILAALIRWPSAYWKRTTLGIGAASLVFVLVVLKSNAVEITVLDVSEGAAIFVQDGSHSLLIDGGSDWDGDRVITSFLHNRGVDSLETVLVTRADKSHVGGLISLAQHFPIQQSLQSLTTPNSKYADQWMETIYRSGIDLIPIHNGDTRAISTRVRLQILDDTPALLLTCENQTILIALDADLIRLANNNPSLHPDFLIVNHFPNRASSPLHPAHTIQLVDRRHPSSDGNHVSIMTEEYFQTDVNGAITIRFLKPDPEIRACLRGLAPLGNGFYE